MTTLKRSIRSGLLFLTLALGAACAGEPVLTIDERVECPVGLIEKVKAEARKQRPETISKIWIGELIHPCGLYGARIEYERACYGTYAIARTFTVEIPGGFFKKHSSESKTEVPYFLFRDEPFTSPRVETEILRIFPLKQTTVFLRLNDDLTYKQVFALLQAIEDGSLKNRNMTETGWKSWLQAIVGTTVHPVDIPYASDLPVIDGIHKVKDGIEIFTTEGRTYGRIYTIKKKEGGYIVISSGRWLS